MFSDRIDLILVFDLDYGTRVLSGCRDHLTLQMELENLIGIR